MGGDDIVAAKTASGAALVATDNSTGVSRLDVNKASGAALDLSKVTFDEIEFSADQGTDAVTVANNANLVVSADQTNLTITTAAAPSQSVTVNLDHDTAGTGITLTDLTTNNASDLTLNLTDSKATYVLTATSMGTADLVVTGDATQLTVTTAAAVGSIDASALNGKVVVSSVEMTKQITTGAGADSFTVNDGKATTLKIDGGAGVDTVVFTASDDFSAGDITFTNIEKLDVSASGVVLAADDLTGKSYVVFGNNLADTLEVEVNSTSGETVDLSDFAGALAKITVTGNNGADTITGLANFATTVNAGSGNDTITGGNLVDTIDGEAGNDTIVAGEGADSITGGTGADTIDLTEATSAVDTVVFATVGDGSTAATTGSFSGYDVITGFASGKDKLDVSAITGAGTEFEVIKSTAPTGTENDLADADFAKVSSVVAFLEANNAVVDNGVADEYVIAVSFSDFTAIYAIDNDGTANTTVEAGEVTLLGTVDVVSVAADYTVA
jgi:Ca2+-binding RTX toxin-like protein